MTGRSFQAPPIGDLLVSDVVGGVGELAGKTLERLTGERLADEGATSLVRRVARAWTTPLGDLTCEQVRLLLGQDMGTPWIAPLACLIVTRWPNVAVTFYPGDLARQILRAFPTIFAADPEGARAVLATDFAWIERLREIDAMDGRADAAETEALLTAARALAS